MSQLLLPRLSEERFAALQAQCHLSAEAIDHLVAELHEAEAVHSPLTSETPAAQDLRATQEDASL